MSARAEILRNIRQHLNESMRHEHRHAPGSITPLPVIDGIAAAPPRFEDQLLAVGGRLTRATRASLDDVIVEVLKAAGARSVVRSGETFTREELFAADAGISAAQWGIAETGTLVLESSQEQHRLVSLVPPLHIAVLPANRVVNTMAEALQRIAPTIDNRLVTFITGPSRTGDIELTLVLGVHGPHTLHVIVCEE